MRILLLCHAFNSLTQRLFVELTERDHTVSVEFDVNDAVTREAVTLFGPDVVIGSFLKRRIPDDVWRAVPCLIVHPGPRGDRGPSALDWAILEGAPRWGVTVLQATETMDGGAIWHSRDFPVRATTKGSLYRHEVAEAATIAILDTLARLPTGAQPTPLVGGGRWRAAMSQTDRAINWNQDTTATVLRKLCCADGVPGVRDEVPVRGGPDSEAGPGNRSVFLHDGHAACGLRGEPGAWIARSGEAVCRATTDGAVWLGRLRLCPRDAADMTLKLPATTVLTELLGAHTLAALPEIAGGYLDLWYEEIGPIGVLYFPFLNGALSANRARRLLSALRDAQSRNTRVLVLMGGPDFWCNGIDLNAIEAAASPADASWEAINAIDDVALALITNDRQITIAALGGNAGAGGVFLARAADLVWCRHGVVLNPHYTGMGNLYGSEYWTYLLPGRCGPERAQIITEARLPMGGPEARRLGLIDDLFGHGLADFRADVLSRAHALAADPALPARCADKRQRRAVDEAAKPLATYRAEELERMKQNFYGFDPSYHIARYNFVFKVPKSRTPLSLAHHRRPSSPWT